MTTHELKTWPEYFGKTWSPSYVTLEMETAIGGATKMCTGTTTKTTIEELDAELARMTSVLIDSQTECEMQKNECKRMTEERDRAIQRLVEISEPGSIGAFARRDVEIERAKNMAAQRDILNKTAQMLYGELQQMTEIAHQFVGWIISEYETHHRCSEKLTNSIKEIWPDYQPRPKP